MRSSRELRLPPGWEPQRRGRVLALALTTPFLTLFLLLLGLGLLNVGLWAVGGWAVTTGIVIALAGYNLLRGHYREKHSLDAVEIVRTDRGSALRIRYSRAVVVVGLAGSALLGVGFTLLGMALWTAGVILFAVPVAGLGLLCLGWLLAWYVRGIRVGELTVSPDLIRLHVDDRDLSVTWEDVIVVDTSQQTDRYRIVSRRRLHLLARKVTGRRPPRSGLRGRLDPAPPARRSSCDAT